MKGVFSKDQMFLNWALGFTGWPIANLWVGNVYLYTLNTKYLNHLQTLMELISFSEYLPHQRQSKGQRGDYCPSETRRGPSENIQS